MNVQVHIYCEVYMVKLFYPATYVCVVRVSSVTGYKLSFSVHTSHIHTGYPVYSFIIHVMYCALSTLLFC